MDNLNKAVGQPLTPPKKFFDWCLQQIPTYTWSNKEQTILASERKDCTIIQKRLTKNSRLSYPEKFYPFAIILVTKNRIEIQSHDYWNEIKDGKEILTHKMINFERFSNGQHLKASIWNGNWHEGLQTNYGYMSGAYTNTKFFPNDWNQQLKKNKDLKYLDLPIITKFELAEVYKYRFQIEYLQNIKATTLFKQVIFNKYDYYNGAYFSEVDMRVLTKNWLKRHKAILKKDNPTFNEIMLNETLRERNAKKVTGIEKLIHYKQFKKLPKEVKLNKFQHYILRQEQSLCYYMDYLYMLEELNLRLNDDSIIYPKELTKAHDNLVSMLNSIKKEKMEKMAKEKRIREEKEQQLQELEYKKRFANLLKLEKEIDEFVFLVPKELQDIIKEGNELHHCVGSSHYLEAHKKGTTNIIFIRKKEDIETPYFTMEFKKNNVEQIQGYKNREEIPNSVKQAISKWKKEIKQVC